MSHETPGLVGESLVSQSELAILLKHLPNGGAFLEVGTWKGVTAAEVADARPLSKIVCVDPFLPGFSTEAGSEEAWRKNAAGRENMTLFVGTSRAYFSAWDAGDDAPAFALAFIDGSHSEEDCLADLETCSRMLAPGGKMACHDYCRDHADPSIAKAVEGFCERRGWRRCDRAHTTVILERKAGRVG